MRTGIRFLAAALTNGFQRGGWLIGLMRPAVGVCRPKRIRRLWKPALIVYLAAMMVVPPQVLFGNPPPPPPETKKRCRWIPCKECKKKGYYVCNDGTGGCYACNPVSLVDGTASEDETDLHLSAQALDWSMERSYSSNISGDTKLGNRWMGGPANVYLNQDGANINLLVNGESTLVFTGSGTPPTYTAPDDSTHKLTVDSTNQQYVLTDTIENIRTTFHDFAVTNTLWRGKLKEESTLQWYAQGKSGFQYSYNATTGLVSQITSPTGQDYSIVFTWSGGDIQKVEIKNAGGTVLEKVEYTYYENVTTPSTDIGATADLVQVKVSRQVPGDSAGTFSYVRYTQYRYSTGSKLKAVYDHEAIQRIMAKLSLGTPEAILQKADTFGTPQVMEFASKSFTYYTAATSTSSITTPFGSENLNTLYGGAEFDETGYVKSETVGAGCSGCGTGTGQTKTYFYTSLSQGTSDQNEVTRILIEDTQDGTGTAVSRTIYGVNDTGRQLRKAFIQDPVGSPKYWCESSKMATTGKQSRLAEERRPSAQAVTTAANLRSFLDPFDSETSSWTNDTNTLNASTGMIAVHTYNTAGRRLDTRVKMGNTGTAYYVSATDYGDGDGDATGDDNANGTLEIAGYYYPTQTTTRTAGIKTSSSYTFYDTADRQIKTKTTTLPAIATGQNGSGVATTMVEYYDNLGRLRWTQNGEGYVGYVSYNPTTGGAAYEATDVDPASPGGDVTAGSSGNWEAWTVGGADSNKPTRDGSLPTALNLVAKTYYDNQGRATQSVDPGGAKHYTVYENLRTISFPYWDGATSKTLMPIQVTKLNNSGQVAESYAVKAGYTAISVTSSAPTGFSTEPSQGDYVSWTRYTYNDTSGQLQYTDRYFDIPSSGTGTLSTNFYRTVTQYDALGRTEYSVQVVSGSSASDRKEQVTRNVYDVRDRVIEVQQGVSGDSAAGSHNMTDDYTTYPTLRTISKTEYDGNGVGDGHVTKTKRYFGTGTNDFTGVNYKRTYRGHLRGIEPFYMNGSTETPIGPFTVSDVSFAGQTTATALYSAAPTWSTVLTGTGYTAYAASTATNRRSLSETAYDDLGRAYQSKQWKVAASNGSASAHFLTNTYYDRLNRPVGVQPEYAAASETAYDGVGRNYQTRTTLVLASTKYSSGKYQYRAPAPKPSLASMSGGDDLVIEMSHSVYGGEQMIESHSFEDNHDDAISATRGIDLTNNDDYVRRSIYNWYDAADRSTTTADYGSGDTTSGAGTWKYASVPSRPGTAPSSSSETALVTKFGYNADTGMQETVTSPGGHVTKTFFDDFGRSTYVAENFDNFNASTEANTGDGSDKSKDRVTKFVYNATSQTKLVALDANADGSLSDNQTTTYLFEDAVSASRKTSEIYPDSSDTTSSGTDQVKLAYNIDGSLATRTDQRGTVIDYTYNNRRQHDDDPQTR